MKPPLFGVELGGHGAASGSAARADVPGDVLGIASQPFPHQAGSIDPAQPLVGPRVAPVPGVALCGRPGHEPLHRPWCSSEITAGLRDWSASHPIGGPVASARFRLAKRV